MKPAGYTGYTTPAEARQYWLDTAEYWASLVWTANGDPERQSTLRESAYSAVECAEWRFTQPL